MLYSTCASASRISTTSLRKDNGDENVLADKKIKIRIVRGGSHPCVRFCSHDSLELADAGAVRMAAHQFLASPGPLSPLQDTFRRIPWPAGRAHVPAAPHDGALGTNAPRGTGEGPGRNAPPLAPISAVATGGKSLSSSECRDQSGPVLLKMLSLDQAARHRRVGF